MGTQLNINFRERTRILFQSVMIRSFYVSAVFFLLFFGLGQRALSGSEDRWAEIARNILLHNDWFHPIINGEIYFDKPLLSYWLIAFTALCTQALNEFSIRLPGALAGLLTLLCSYKIAAEWFDRRIAWLSICFILTSYGFLFWTHTASAELSNLALITAAVAWFIHRRERTDFWTYMIFYLLCAIGSQLKGLTAIVVPILVIAPYVLRNRRWKTHFNVFHLAALVLALGLFLLPYLGAALQPLPIGVEVQHNQLSGLELLIRENIIRFFQPFDHVAPFYSYAYEVPRIVFPWSFLLFAALAYYGPRYPKLDQPRRWLLEAIALVFLFFTFSGSRRWYYILPIMPFCMMLIAAYMAEASEHRWRRPAALVTLFSLSVAAVLLIALPVAVQAYLNSESLPMAFWIGSIVTVVGAGVIVLLGIYRMPTLRRITGVDSALSGYFLPILLVFSALEMTVIFGFVLPGADSYRQQKPFALSLAKQLGHGEKVVFYKRSNSTLVFYMDSADTIPVINSRSDISKSGGKWIIVTEEADKESLFNEFPELKSASPMIAFDRRSEKFFSDKSHLLAYRLF